MMGMRIPILDLAPEIKKHRAEFQDAIERVLLSAEFIQGTETKLFEKEVAEYLGVKHAIGLNSGTDGLVIGLRALGVGPGDQVHPVDLEGEGVPWLAMGARVPLPALADAEPNHALTWQCSPS